MADAALPLTGVVAGGGTAGHGCVRLSLLPRTRCLTRSRPAEDTLASLSALVREQALRLQRLESSSAAERPLSSAETSALRRQVAAASAAHDTAPLYARVRELAAAMASRADEADVSARLAEAEERAAAAAAESQRSLAELSARLAAAERSAEAAQASARAAAGEAAAAQAAARSTSGEAEAAQAAARAASAEAAALRAEQRELGARLAEVATSLRSALPALQDGQGALGGGGGREALAGLHTRLQSAEGHLSRLAQALGALEPKQMQALAHLKDKVGRSLTRMRAELVEAASAAAAEAAASARRAERAAEEGRESREALAPARARSEGEAELLDGLSALRVGLGALTLRVAQAEAGLEARDTSPAALQQLAATLSAAHEAQAARLERCHASLRSLVAALAADLAERPTEERVRRIVGELAGARRGGGEAV